MDTYTPEMMALESNLNGALGIAAARGFDVPPGFAKARALEQAARRLIHAAGPPPRAMPTKPADVAAWVAEVAAERAQWRDTQAVAEELAGMAKRESLAAAQAAIPAWLTGVCDLFDAAVEEFTQLAGTAPHIVNGQTTGTEFEQHAALLRAVDALSALAADRGRLALLAREADDIGPDALWLVLKPADSAMLGQVVAALTDLRGRFPTTLDEWERAAGIGLRAARGGEVLARRERFGALQYAAGLTTPDGGRRDRAYFEAAALLAEASPTHRQMAALR